MVLVSGAMCVEVSSAAQHVPFAGGLSYVSIASRGVFAAVARATLGHCVCCAASGHIGQTAWQGVPGVWRHQWMFPAGSNKAVGGPQVCGVSPMLMVSSIRLAAVLYAGSRALR